MALVAHAASFLIITAFGYVSVLTQFDNCITVPESSNVYLGFLALVPVLLTAALWPLVPYVIRHSCELWQIVQTQPSIQVGFLQRWWSWVLGPIPRFGAAMYLGAFSVLCSTPTCRRSSSIHVFPRYPSLSLASTTYAHRCSAWIARIGFVSSLTIALLVSTVYHATRGRLTIDVERERALRRQRNTGKSSTSPYIQPVKYLWIPNQDGAGQVVPVSTHYPYQRDWRSNLGAYFGLLPLPPFTPWRSNRQEDTSQS